MGTFTKSLERNPAFPLKSSGLNLAHAICFPPSLGSDQSKGSVQMMSDGVTAAACVLIINLMALQGDGDKWVLVLLYADDNPL